MLIATRRIFLCILRFFSFYDLSSCSWNHVATCWSRTHTVVWRVRTMRVFTVLGKCKAPWLAIWVNWTRNHNNASNSASTTKPFRAITEIAFFGIRNFRLFYVIFMYVSERQCGWVGESALCTWPKWMRDKYWWHYSEWECNKAIEDMFIGICLAAHVLDALPEWTRFRRDSVGMSKNSAEWTRGSPLEVDEL